MNAPDNDLIRKSYVDILKYSSKESFVTYESIYNYIYRNQIKFYPEEIVSESSAILQTFFKTFFRDGEGRRPGDPRKGIYYLSPEALLYLLNNESLDFAKQNSLAAAKEAKLALIQAKRANWVAILSFAVTSLLAAVQIFLELR